MPATKPADANGGIVVARARVMVRAPRVPEIVHTPAETGKYKITARPIAWSESSRGPLAARHDDIDEGWVPSSQGLPPTMRSRVLPMGPLLGLPSRRPSLTPEEKHAMRVERAAARQAQAAAERMRVAVTATLLAAILLSIVTAVFAR